ncbi:hypothetical protein GH769_00510 [Pseudomonas sp. CFSAN084952]|uniref:hypothetical protein n=1 Tax=Pseudomonas TaxID=286 RepID=UPI001299FA29|nr:hypothetical protein [Pseudomonas sp. CFSAN084952]QGF91768.1 hypothetical protein GH769_00510 [Pseudomonas sp. CFSAN084952]
MNNHHHNTDVSDALLVTSSALREVGFDEVADLFREALFDRQLVAQALAALQMLVKNASNANDGQFANETAFRLFQKMSRLVA